MTKKEAHSTRLVMIPWRYLWPTTKSNHWTWMRLSSQQQAHFITTTTTINSIANQPLSRFFPDKILVEESLPPIPPPRLFDKGRKTNEITSYNTAQSCKLSQYQFCCWCDPERDGCCPGTTPPPCVLLWLRKRRSEPPAMARVVSGVSFWPRDCSAATPGLTFRLGGLAIPDVPPILPAPKARGRIWAARGWAEVLGTWRRLSSSWSFLSAGPILLVSCCAAFAWF